MGGRYQQQWETACCQGLAAASVCCLHPAIRIIPAVYEAQLSYTSRGGCFQRPPAGSAWLQLRNDPTSLCLQVGAIIGKGGQVITELKSCLSVEIRISDKHDLLPGTNDRKVTITGPADMVPIAQTVILKKISQSSESQ